MLFRTALPARAGMQPGRHGRADADRWCRAERVVRIGPGYRIVMRIGNMEIKPLGGGAGCLTMILLSILLSVLLTVLLNLLL